MLRRRRSSPTTIVSRSKIEFRVRAFIENKKEIKLKVFERWLKMLRRFWFQNKKNILHFFIRTLNCRVIFLFDICRALNLIQYVGESFKVVFHGICGCVSSGYYTGSLGLSHNCQNASAKGERLFFVLTYDCTVNKWTIHKNFLAIHLNWSHL